MPAAEMVLVSPDPVAMWAGTVLTYAAVLALLMFYREVPGLAQDLFERRRRHG